MKHFALGKDGVCSNKTQCRNVSDVISCGQKNVKHEILLPVYSDVEMLCLNFL